jgi:hypothetical protein
MIKRYLEIESCHECKHFDILYTCSLTGEGTSLFIPDSCPLKKVPEENDKGELVSG